MISPALPRAIMLGAKMRAPLMMPHMLTPMMRCQLSDTPNNVLPGWMPALFISRSVPPKCAPTARSSSVTLSTRLTSTTDVITFVAAVTDDSFVAASASRPSSTSAMHTFIPARANAVAAARPMPEAPPVITATLPLAMTGCGMAILREGTLRSVEL